MKRTDWAEDVNLTMLTDFYELTMANGYFEHGLKDRIAVFDMFFRKVPDDGGFAIMAGLEQLITYLKNLKFEEEDIAFLRSKGIFCEEFLQYLSEFTFCCDVWAVEEGTPIFPQEPVVIVRGPVIQAQFVETMVLLSINHQSLIATKANRIVRAAQGRAVMEFGSRRAQGSHGAIMGARAAYIGGCVGTACAICEQYYQIPALGTMAHSWVQMFDSEYEAFATYARLYPDGCVLLVDTYNVTKSGVPNAIKVFDEVLKPLGKRPKGIRIDSGDIAYLSKKARKMLDEAGYEDCPICASNSLDEYIVRDLILQEAKIDSFGIGENLITAKSDPVFGGVYKLAAVKEGDSYIPKIKVSESVEKITLPCLKKVWRIYDNYTRKAMADYVAVYDEEVGEHEELTLFDPNQTWKQRTYKNCTVKCLTTPIYKEGKLVYDRPTVTEIRTACAEQVENLWEEMRRFEYPHRYYVDYSRKLWECRQELLTQISRMGQ